MPSFDLARGCIVMKIVYDGPALAGKTTNLQKLCSMFPIERRSELFTPGALKGRTMFFDWLEIDGGKKGRHAYRFQLLTVPGQTQRSYRRRPLLQMADAVVFVCSAAPESLLDTRRSFATLRRHLKAREDARIPLVVQANKQDTPGALATGDLARALKLDPEVTVLPATASDGVGVRETLLAIVRAAARRVQEQLARGELEAFSENPGTADDLFMSMLELEDADEEAHDAVAEDEEG
ncbi:MAG TPA: ADP-ribosylation factor-like protein [Polyangiaceae bacterium]|jgi:signal recognition particle receptor subunit beta|nr:ADP-ribosylation factor-like protein [Polyangiaceae bacterium]